MMKYGDEIAIRLRRQPPPTGFKYTAIYIHIIIYSNWDLHLLVR